MRIILLQDVRKLGKKYDIKEVSEGYARNFLIPKGLAKFADKTSAKGMLEQKKIIEKKRENIKMATDEIIKKISGKEFHFYIPAGENKSIFKPVTKKDILEIIGNNLNSMPENTKDEIISKIKLDLPRSLKILGSHTIAAKLEDKKFEIKVILNQDGIN